ncbi:MAG: thiamine pyrophosphate-binding protein, partial [Veillonella sp.]|nr:thiamine pyrophosphate-binding protein [Veillonella sp.]
MVLQSFPDKINIYFYNLRFITYSCTTTCGTLLSITHLYKIFNFLDISNENIENAICIFYIVKEAPMISGAAYVVKALQEEQVDILFNYPGAATIDIMDELYKQDKVKVILPRHEQALAHAADGYARSTGKVGVCMVTSGPGATNLVTGIATAYADSVPLVCITGQVD